MRTQQIFLTLVLVSFLIVFSCRPEVPLPPICPPTSVDECSRLKKIRKYELIVELQPGVTSSVLIKEERDSFINQLANDFLEISPEEIDTLYALRECNCDLMLLAIEIPESIWIDIDNGPAGSMSPPEDQNTGEGFIASVGMNYDINIRPAYLPEDSLAINITDKGCNTRTDSLTSTSYSNCGGTLPLYDGPEVRDDLTIIGLIDTGTDPRHNYGREVRENTIVSNKLFYLSQEVEFVEDDIVNGSPGAQFELDGIDQNGNCVNDDLWGFDYYHGDNNPLDLKGHGTHIAGTILSAGESKGGESGIRIMTLQIGGYQNNNLHEAYFECDLFAILCAVNYAVENGAKVINMSLGYYSPYYHVPFRRQLARAIEKDVLVVTSLGNDGSNVDSCSHWPSNFSRIFPKNVIAVAALGNFTSNDVNFQLAPFSNYGQHADLAAPGWMIKSAMAGSFDEYIELSGTSMAAAVVSRRAAMIRDSVILAGGTITAAQIKTQILQEAEVDQSLCVSGGRVLTHRSDSTLLEAIGY